MPTTINIDIASATSSVVWSKGMGDSQKSQLVKSDTATQGHEADGQGNQHPGRRFLGDPNQSQG